MTNKAKGEIGLDVAPRGLVRLHEAGGYRVKFPMNETIKEAVLVNTAGGLVGGDSLAIALKVDAPLMVSTTGAEKIYGGAKSQLSFKAEVTSALYWLPLETILYDNADFERKCDVVLSASAKIVFAEMMVFGRLAFGEAIKQARFHDMRHIYRENKLINAENMLFDGNMHEKLDVKAIGNGARAMATIISTEGNLDELREIETSECAFTQKNGLIIARFMSSDVHSLRLIYSKTLAKMIAHSLPRNW
jgi:urease accessory protein